MRGCEQLTMQPEALMLCMIDIIQNVSCTILQLSQTISDSVHVLRSQWQLTKQFEAASGCPGIITLTRALDGLAVGEQYHQC